MVGHGASESPAGAEHYTAESLMEDKLELFRQTCRGCRTVLVAHAYVSDGQPHLQLYRPIAVANSHRPPTARWYTRYPSQIDPTDTKSTFLPFSFFFSFPFLSPADLAAGTAQR